MDCMLDRNLIQEYLDGSLGQIEGMILEEHMKICEPCKNEFEYMSELFHEFDSIKGSVDVPQGLPLLRNQILNGIEGLGSDGRFGIREFMKIQEAAFRGAGIFYEFVPGSRYIKNGVKKTPRVLYKTLSFAFKGGMKLMAARSKP